MSVEEPELKYYQIDDDLGYTPQDLPEGSTEISYDTYITLLAEIAEAVAAAQAAVESS